MLALPNDQQAFASDESSSTEGEVSASVLGTFSDFNGDGYDDLAIGVPNENIGGTSDSGAVSVIYGSAAGLRATSPADQFWHQGKPGVEDAEETGDGFGSLSSFRTSFVL